eukprot:7206854-Pyramimonas_sp.AAC.1
MPKGQRHRGRVDRAKLAGRCARKHARASAATEMHKPTPSMYRNRRRMGFANQVAEINCTTYIAHRMLLKRIAQRKLHRIDYTASIAPRGCIT